MAPRTPTEEVLAGIWREVLGVERVGVHDDFFELGGHSLLATQVVVAHPQGASACELPLRTLFEAPTVAELAAADRRRPAAVAAEAWRRRWWRSRAACALPLSFAQQRLWFLDQLEPGSAAYNIPAALRLRGALDVEALRRASTTIVRAARGAADHVRDRRTASRCR